jgi:hypothetical protein
LDVSVKETSVCIVDEMGKIVREVKVASEPEALLAVLSNPAYHFKRMGLEAGPLSQWLYIRLCRAGRNDLPDSVGKPLILGRVTLIGQVHLHRCAASEGRAVRACGSSRKSWKLGRVPSSVSFRRLVEVGKVAHARECSVYPRRSRSISTSN